MLGVFVLAFYFRRVTANGAFIGVLVGEAAIFATNQFTTLHTSGTTSSDAWL